MIKKITFRKLGDHMRNILFIFLTLVSISTYGSDKLPFNQWLVELKSELVEKQGFSDQLVEEAFNGVKFNEQVIVYDRRQPEFVRSTGSYIRLIISKARIEKGQRYKRELDPLLENIMSDYSVQGRFLLSFWALETNFSSHTGKMDIIECLLTLMYDGRREAFFKRELINALKVLEMDNFVYPTDRLLGSWAGAMGSTQFIPVNILQYALDYDGDGLINMWENRPDFLGSSANFLSKVGWNGNESWGYLVELPENFDYMNSGLGLKKSTNFWKGLGLVQASGEEIVDSKNDVALYLPQGHKGPKFLVYNNFFTTLKWNNSAKYALGIGVLSDLITDKGEYFNQFDLKEPNFLTFDLTKQMQARLNELGHNAGKVDGIPGPMTYKAVQLFQQSKNLIADGHVTKELLDLILN
jgi:membrane-bound lytic murein transglycosylase B